MRRKIANPRIILLDCTLEYKKGESQTNVEITNEGDWEALLKAEEDWIKQTVSCLWSCEGLCVRACGVCCVCVCLREFVVKLYHFSMCTTVGSVCVDRFDA